MKIYFFTALNGNKFAGPSYSVPRTIEEISKQNNTVWINMLPKYDADSSVKSNTTYISLDEYKLKGLKKIIDENGKPDFVIFEEVLCVHYCHAASILTKIGAPYMIVPRGSLCRDAQRKKWLKKKVANVLLFNKFIKNAACIQYLTEKEKIDSGSKWNKNYYIIPNGTDIKEINKPFIEHFPLKGVFIGRLDIFHKGIDFLIEALSNKRELIKDKLVIEMYGADSVGHGEKIKALIEDRKLQNILHLNGPVYDDEKESVLRNADFFVLTSRFEGHPMGLLEALSYKLPALVTYGSNMGEEIKKSSSGFVGETSAEGVEKALTELVNNIPNFPSYRENSYALAKQYSWVSICESILSIAEKLSKGDC